MRHGKRFAIPERNALILDMDEVEAKKSFTCSICMEEKFTISRIFVLSCKHHACFMCYRSYLENKIKERSIASLKCIVPGCQTKFTFEDVRDLASKPIMEVYQKHLAEECLSRDKVCFLSEARLMTSLHSHRTIECALVSSRMW